MRGPLSLRIVRWPFKLVYVVVANLALIGISRLIGLVPLPPLVLGTIAYVLDIAAILYGARVFRGRREEVTPPRALWRMTAGRPLSLGIGILTALASFVSVTLIIVAVNPPASTRTDHAGVLGAAISLVAFYAVVSALYFNSAAHLPKVVRANQDPASRIDELYKLFNARLAEQTASLLTADVQWPNGWEGGYISGRLDVIRYWKRQWSEIDPIVTPTAVHVDEDGRLVVDVHQVVRALDGKLISDTMLQHVYTPRSNLFERMEIREVAPAT